MITDFDVAHDRLDLSSVPGIISFDHLDREQYGTDTILHLGGGQTAILENLDADDLTAAHVDFDVFEDLTDTVTRFSGGELGVDLSGDALAEGDSASFSAALDNDQTLFGGSSGAAGASLYAGAAGSQLLGNFLSLR